MIAKQFIPMGQINNIPALVQLMAWRRPGDEPLSESMMVSLLMQSSLGLNELTMSPDEMKNTPKGAT